MNTDKKISRREALKRMGFAVMSSAIAVSYTHLTLPTNSRV